MIPAIHINKDCTMMFVFETNNNNKNNNFEIKNDLTKEFMKS